MKAIGHVASALIAATPVIYFRGELPEVFGAEAMNVYELLWWTGLFAVLPDTDIILQKFLPVKHRGYFSHSIFTILLAGAIVVAGVVLAHQEVIPQLKYCTPFSAILASFSVFMHLVGDSITKTGVPFFWPNKACHFPFIGGYAAFDNIFLNAIPVALAAFIVSSVFGYNPKMMNYFGKFKDFTKVFKIDEMVESSADNGSE